VQNLARSATLWRVTDLAATAAFVAAGLSLVNVGITAKLTSRGQREQWQREQEQPIVARCLTLSQEASHEWFEASTARVHRSPGDALMDNANWKEGRKLLHDLRYEVARLDLLASSPVRRVASDLVEAHVQESNRLGVTTPRPDEAKAREASQDLIAQLQAALVDGARADLGLGPAKPSKSLLGMLLAAINSP
jgi:hypothetical protein